MKTLVIHPRDITTDFLIPVWSGRPDWEIVRSSKITKSELRRLIKQNDRIVCLGHGCDKGLFRSSKMDSFMIDSTYVYLLRDKECFFVWCNCDVFFRKYNLRGFFTGMIISEAREADYCEIYYDVSDIDKANDKLSKALLNGLNKDGKDILTEVKKFMNPETSVESFNYKNLYSTYDN